MIFCGSQVGTTKATKLTKPNRDLRDLRGSFACPRRFMNTLTRRDLLRTAGVLGGGAALASVFPPSIARAYALLQQAPDPVAAAAAARAGTAMIPIEVTKLTDTL